MDGPREFPGPSYTKSGTPNGHDMGMTLRDYFAGQAMAAMITTANGPLMSHGQWQGAEALTAKSAYEVADAMLKAREGE
jgi:hypothetical protein